MGERVAITSYRESWPAEFAQLAGGLRADFGDRALRIDHIGSTAVPGLPAKDVIDIQVTVARLAEVPATLSGLQARPIVDDHPPPGFAGDPAELAKRFFRARVPRAVNVHVREAGRLNQRYPLLFRDYLRATPAAAEAYAAVKRVLAAHFADDVDTYSDVKDPVVDVVMAGAEAWACAAGWQPGPADA
jgi:GrpB-like predicted nucleotidyltransferase (UPF0157 family)